MATKPAIALEKEMNSKPKAYSYIRFSIPGQVKGDSLRRQVTLSEKYAREHGLTLDNSLRLTDRGLSAYKGIHRAKGPLGEFLKLVEQGRIEKGAIFLKIVDYAHHHQICILA